MSEEFMTVDEVAAMMRLNRKTIYDAVKQGELPGARTVRGTIRIHKPTLLASFEAGEVPVKKRKASK